jgi:hypothetical protein
MPPRCWPLDEYSRVGELDRERADFKAMAGVALAYRYPGRGGARDATHFRASFAA